MRWWTRSTRALRSALHNLLSPTLGVNPCAEPVLAWLVRGQHLTLRRAVLLLVAGVALMLPLMLLAWIIDMPLFDWALWLLVVMRLLFDWPVLTRALGCLTPELASGRWDMLRLTLQTEGTLLRSYRAATGAAAWPLTVGVVGAQTAALIVGLVWLFTRIDASAPEYAVTCAALALVFGAELFYRRRALVAVGLSISAASSRGAAASLAGGMALLLLWIGQGAAVVAGLLAFGSLFGFLALVWPSLHGIWWAGPGIALIALHLFVEHVALVRLAQIIARRHSAA